MVVVLDKLRGMIAGAGSESGARAIVKIEVPQPVHLIVTDTDGGKIDRFSGDRFDFVGMTVAEAVAKARTEFNPFEVELGFGGTYFDADKINFVEVSADFILEFLGQVGRILAVAGSFGFTAQNVFKAADNILDFSADYIEFFLIFFGVK